MNNIPWDKLYRGRESIWGQRPDHLLSEFADLIPQGVVLDLGIGEGRNSILFGALGHEIEGVDISQTAIERCTQRFRNEGFNFTGHVRNLKDVNISDGEYSLIIAAWVLNFFRKSEAAAIIGGIKSGLANGGFVYFSAFTPDDPGYKKASATSTEIEKNSFHIPEKDSYANFFTKDEVLAYFDGFNLIHCSEGTQLDSREDDPHYHHYVMYFGQKCD